MDPVLSNLSAYGGKYAQQLLGQLFVNLSNQEVTVLTDIKGKTKFAKLLISKGLKPYTGIFTPSDKTNYTDRAVDPQMFQYDLLLDPRQYRNSYMTEMIDKNAKANSIPYENFFWQKVMEQVAHEIVMSGMYKGQAGGSDSDTAKNIFNGFEFRISELITDGVAPIVTGTITSANAVTKFENFYTEAMEANPAWRGKMLNIYCSHSNFDKYTDAYRSLFNGQDPSNWSDAQGSVYLKKNKGKVKITPVDWMGTSNRLILAPKENLVLATDSLSDLSTINVVQDVYQLKGGMSGTIDCQIIDSEAVWFNEQS